MTTNALIYAKANARESILAQIKECSEYAAENGLTICAVAETPAEFESCVLEDDIDAVIVKGRAYITRDAKERIVIMGALRELGVTVEFVNK